MKTLMDQRIMLALLSFSLLAFLPIGCGEKDLPMPPPPPAEPPPPPTPTTTSTDSIDDTSDDSCEFENIDPNLNEGPFDFECKGNAFLPSDKISPDNEGGNWGIFGHGATEADSDFLAIEYIENPDKSGINESDRVLQITEQPNIDDWAGFFFDLAETVNFPDGKNAISVHVWSREPGQKVLLKLEDSANGDSFTESAVTTTETEKWENLIYNFPATDTGKYDRLTMIMNQGKKNEEEVLYYLDNIAFSDPKAVEPGEEPTDDTSAVEATAPDVPAENPTIDADDVISIFSDAYDDVEGTDLNPNWGQQTVATVEEINSDASILKYENLNYQGIQLSSPIDVSEKSLLHVNYWVSNSTKLNIYLINSANVTGSDAVEKGYELSLDVKSKWVSAEIDLGYFSDAGVDLTKIDQLKIDGDGTVYFDDILFFGTTSNTSNDDTDASGETGGESTDDTTTEEATAPDVPAEDPTIDAEDVISIFSDAYDDVEGTNFKPNWGQQTVATIEELSSDASILKYENLDFQGIQLAGPIDVSEKSLLHVNYWVSNSTVLKIFLINSSQVTGSDFVEKDYTLSLDVKSKWVSVKIDLGVFSDAGVDLAKIDQLKIEGDGTVYFDDILFFGTTASTSDDDTDASGETGGESTDDTTTEEATAPDVPAEDPTIDAEDVISIFSDAYDDVEGTNFKPNWGQQTVATIEELSSDASILKYENLDFQGIQLAGPIDVSEKSLLHVNYWVSNSTVLKIFLINSSQVTGSDFVEKDYTLSLDVKSKWVSVKIDLGVFSDAGVDLAKIDQLKIEGDGTVYFDDILFFGTTASTSDDDTDASGETGG